MKDHTELLENYFLAFSKQQAKEMIACYHPEVTYYDPVFKHLNALDVRQMWEMLLDQRKGAIQIEYGNISADENSGKVKWNATYIFSKTHRKVVNRVSSEFEFKNGLIFNQKDTFNLWRWSRQAFGLKGLLFGWTSFMQTKIRTMARQSLFKFHALKV